MIKGSSRPLVFMTIVALLATPALASDALKSRIAGYREIGAAFKNVNDELRSSTPQIFVIQLSGREIRNLSREQYTWFPADSRPRAGVKTRAKPEVWLRASEFKAAQDAFAAQANNFASVAQGGDIERIRAAARALGTTCAACHRQFRTEG